MSEDTDKKAAFDRALAKLPPHVREMVDKDPGKLVEILKREQQAHKKDFPSISFVPNIGQERSLKCLAKSHPVNGWPHKVFVLGGNGSGKTCDMCAVLLPGACLGPEFVNREYCNWDFFRHCAEIRRERKLHVRIVCDAKDMKQDGGSVYQQIEKWIPIAEFKNKTGDFFQTVQIGDVTVDVKTYDMPIRAHAGPDMDIVIFNEPPPEQVYDENVTRTRGTGTAFVFCTPLDIAAYLLRETQQPAPEGEIIVNEISLWDNCADIPGNRGQVPRKEIEKQIRDWSKNPDTLDARVFGKFAHLSGAIFKVFREDIHVIDPFQIDNTFTLYHVCDPHLVKPPFGMWIAVNALGQMFIVAEYPNDPWDTVKSTEKTIRHFAREFFLIEEGHNANFGYMRGVKPQFEIGDPNLMGMKLPNTNRTIAAEYALHGRNYDCRVPDSLELGHDAIRELLFYDQQRTLDSNNFPKLQVFRTCRNSIRALKEYGIKRTADQYAGTADRIDKTWECPIGCLRYFAMKNEGYVRSDNREMNDEWQRMKNSRNPYRQRHAQHIHEEEEVFV